jgi:hypothetical protein
MLVDDVASYGRSRYGLFTELADQKVELCIDNQIQAG